MPDPVETPIAQDQSPTVSQPTVNPFATNAWSEQQQEPKKSEPANPEPSVSSPASQSNQPAEEEAEIFDENEWLKRTFDVDSIDIIKQEREEYQKLKTAKPEEIKFENEQSKTIYQLLKEGKTKDVQSYLNMQEKLDTFISAEINKDTSADIIKLGMKLKHPALSDTEIDYKYSKEFATPKAPTKSADELDEDFEARMESWKEIAADKEMNRMIEAKLVLPELQKAKSQLVLPELNRPTSNEPTPEELAEQMQLSQKARENFLNKLESDFSKVDGFSVKVRDEEVEFPVQYKITEAERDAIKERLKEGFDINEYMDKRWFDETGNPKINQIISDIYEMENREKVHSSIANNAATLRLEQYRKSARNIDLKNGQPQNTFDPTKQPGANQVNPFSKNAWSEKPVMINN